jgi:hypothetical protein
MYLICFQLIPVEGTETVKLKRSKNSARITYRNQPLYSNDVICWC